MEHIDTSIAFLPIDNNHNAFATFGIFTFLLQICWKNNSKNIAWIFDEILSLNF